VPRPVRQGEQLVDGLLDLRPGDVAGVGLAFVVLGDLQVTLTLEVDVPQLDPEVLRRLETAPPAGRQGTDKAGLIQQRRAHHLPRARLPRRRRGRIAGRRPRIRGGAARIRLRLCLHRAIVADRSNGSQNGLARSRL
jgi:hypothetical protein